MKLPVWTENLNNWLKKTCDLDWLEMIYVLLPLLLGVVYCSGLSTDLCKYYQTFVGKILFWAAIVVMVIF